MGNVNLLPGLFQDSQEKGKEYLLYLDVDRLVAPCYEAVGREAKKPRYGGWESTGIAGHSIGHWLSAAAVMVSVSNSPLLKQKLDYAIDELAYIQSLDDQGYVSGFPRQCFDNVFSGEFEVGHFNLGGSWVPWYSIHKIYAGLIDAYNYTGNEKALEVVIKLADWAKQGLDKITDEQFQRMLTCEHGGMNEAFADLYLITENKDYLKLAERFYHELVLEPLAKGEDDLEGKHANTQIPKVIGCAKLYDITGKEKYKRIATFFWDQVTNFRSYVIGGNSIREHFGPENAEELGILTTETCNTYNMLKLTEHLFDWSHDSNYIDFYERALYNHILASQDPDSGMKTYFVSTQPGHFKVYCSADNSFWCCTGTGMENPARYTRSIYYRNGDDLFVNLFIASRIDLEDRDITIEQKTTFPETNRISLVFKDTDNSSLSLKIRVPYWAAGEVLVTVNGESVNGKVENGYLTVTKDWVVGDHVEVELPINLHIYQAKDDRLKKSIMYGPVVLAGALGRENYPETDILDDHQELNNHPLIDVPVLVTDKEDPNEWISKDPLQLVFKTEAVGKPGNVSITLVPFYQLHHQRYSLYWKMMNTTEFATYKDTEKEEADRRRRITVDIVNPNEQQPEVDHNMQAENSFSGYLNVVHSGWRDSRGDGYFSYDMAVESDKQMYIVVTYYGSDANLHVDGKMYERYFEILVDGQVIGKEKLHFNKPGELFDEYYEIPRLLTEGKDKVTVKFKSEEGNAAGAVYEVKIVNDRN
ncbi:glycoside hydrolase family 127 protein [Aquibacillus salsiterrae]|uniref:Glycoside hydrolase family 127 protein n=1 Tax=Aquibacillus salsiterrae TaxID=2950439 RepID=A0A9X3WE95_9BACI|nr:glycoside hydrolase family 127 protein [Aquibacillus salsiterrae]MDC3416856.1 glycoside hydrolase family 127 protein [Aquibacillus salsiterrae]